MRTYHEQGKRDKVITLRIRLSIHELRIIATRLNDVRSTNSVWVQFAQFVEEALVDSKEPL